MPDLASPFELDLFNTYRWYLFPQHYPVDLDRGAQASGHSIFKHLFKGQSVQSIVPPAATIGNHYHRRTLKRCLVMQGEALIRTRQLLRPDVSEFRVSGARPQFVDIPTLHVHNMTNVGQTDLMTLEWTPELFDASKSDSYSEEI